jgi:hypothetical protein
MASEVPVTRTRVVAPGAAPVAVTSTPMPPKASSAFVSVRVDSTLPVTKEVVVSEMLAVLFKITLLEPVVRIPEAQFRFPVLVILIFPEARETPPDVLEIFTL